MDIASSAMVPRLRAYYLQERYEDSVLCGDDDLLQDDYWVWHGQAEEIDILMSKVDQISKTHSLCERFEIRNELDCYPLLVGFHNVVTTPSGSYRSLENTIFLEIGDN